MLKDKLLLIKVKNQHWIKELSDNELKELYNLTEFLEKSTSPTIRRIYVINDIIETSLCPICKKEISKIDSANQKLTIFCSNKCRRSTEGKKIITDKMVTTCKEKYGDDHYVEMGKCNIDVSDETKEKRRVTNNKRYGVNNVFQNDKIKDKSKKSSVEKYGKEFYTQTEEYKDRYIETCIEKYGVDNVSKIDSVKSTINKTRRENFWDNFNILLQSKHVKPLFDKDTYVLAKTGDVLQFYCDRCNKSFNFTLKTGQGMEIKDISCGNHTYQSSGEHEISDWLEQTVPNIEILKNKRFKHNGKTLELDIYLPKYNIGIEYHGLYWHSEAHKDKNYHFKKHEHFQNLGIEVIQIFQSEWKYNTDIVKSIISNKLSILEDKVFARHCAIREVKTSEYRLFLELNHLQGYCPAKIKLGLYKNDELLQIMSFSKPRFNKKYDWENIRTATKINTVVIGGFSKLFKSFTKNYSGSIISYIDIRYFTGKGYESNGFINNGYSKPNFFYFKNSGGLILENRMKFQKHKLEKILDTFDPNLTEHLNMLKNGYLRIYDAGNIIMIK